MLTSWGIWWRRNEGKGLGYSPVSPSARLMELARVGCSIQGTRRVGRSDEIRVPAHIREIDRVVERLPCQYRQAIVGLYVRRGVRRRGPVHIRAEDEVAERFFPQTS